MAAHSTSDDHVSALRWANSIVIATLYTQTASLARTKIEFFAEAIDLAKRLDGLVTM